MMAPAEGDKNKNDSSTDSQKQKDTMIENAGANGAAAVAFRLVRPLLLRRGDVAGVGATVFEWDAVTRTADGVPASKAALVVVVVVAAAAVLVDGSQKPWWPSPRHSR